MEQAFVFIGLSIIFGMGVGIGLGIIAEISLHFSGKGREVFLAYSKIEKTDEK